MSEVEGTLENGGMERDSAVVEIEVLLHPRLGAVNTRKHEGQAASPSYLELDLSAFLTGRFPCPSMSCGHV